MGGQRPVSQGLCRQDAFTRAEIKTRVGVPSRRYVYVPSNLPKDAIGRVWAEVHPEETVVSQEEQGLLPTLALDRVRHRVRGGVAVLHLVSSKRAPLPAAAAG